MLFLTTTKWNVWFLWGVREQGTRSDCEPSGPPATHEGERARMGADFSAGILIKGGGSGGDGKADSVLASLLLGWVGVGGGHKVKWETRKQQRLTLEGELVNAGERAAEKRKK